MGVYLDMSSYEEIKEKQIKHTEKMLKYLCLTVLGFCSRFGTGGSFASDPNNDAYCLAQNMYFEVSVINLKAGKIAVSQVVINRTQHMNYPSDICGVVYQAKWRENWKGNQVPVRHQCQFSWFCDGGQTTQRTQRLGYNV